MSDRVEDITNQSSVIGSKGDNIITIKGIEYKVTPVIEGELLLRPVKFPSETPLTKSEATQKLAAIVDLINNDSDKPSEPELPTRWRAGSDEKLELFRLASLIGCEPEDEERHRQDLFNYIRSREINSLAAELMDLSKSFESRKSYRGYMVRQVISTRLKWVSEDGKTHIGISDLCKTEEVL